MKYCVYILQSLKDGSFYKGLTGNLEKRVREHDNGKCKSTAMKRPLKLVYYEEFSSRVNAREREKFFKTGEGRELLRQLVK